MSSSSIPASKQLNPFYIDKVKAGQNGDDDDWADSFDDDNGGWGDDEEDLEDLLEQEGQQPRRSKGGYLPVRNLAGSQQQFENDTRWRRNSYCCLLLVAVVVAAFVHARNRSSFPHDDGKTPNHDGKPIQRITILGERNSGLEWLEARLKECYPNHVTVSSTLFRKGYFFQDKPVKGQEPKTIVVAIFLNPYDWVELMRTKPQFMPLHSNIGSWKPFLTSPWTMDRPPSDATFSNSPTKARVCQHNFSYHQVVSCTPGPDGNNATDLQHPTYELQRSGSGEPYSSILKLRRDKIRNFVQEVAKFDNVEKVVKIRYESLVEDTVDDKGQPTGIPGLWTALQDISRYSEYLDPLCDLEGPGKKHFFAPAMGKHDGMTSDFVDFMNAQLDWDTEKLVGYQQWDANKIPVSPTNYYEDSDEIGPSHSKKDNDKTDANTDDTATDDATGTTASPTASAVSPIAPTTKPIKPSPKPTKGSVSTKKPSKKPTKKPVKKTTAVPSPPSNTRKPFKALTRPTKKPASQLTAAPSALPKTDAPTTTSTTPPSPAPLPATGNPSTTAPGESGTTPAPSNTPVITAPPKKDNNRNKGSDSPSVAPSAPGH